MSELNLTVILTQMDGHLEGLEDYFIKYKTEMKKLRNNFGAFKATAKRRRAMQQFSQKEKINAFFFFHVFSNFLERLSSHVLTTTRNKSLKIEQIDECLIVVKL